ncbi:methyltransferase family protein, partial [Cesiribacter andamanensis]
ILFYNAIISHARLLPPDGLFRYLGLMLTTAGVLVIRQAFRVYSLQEFVGLKPQEGGKALGNRLRTDGILKRVRHPLYAGNLLVLLGFWLYIPTWANLITVGMAIGYIFIGIRLEERDLERQYGELYRQYKRQVPMLIPRFGRRGGI